MRSPVGIALLIVTACQPNLPTAASPAQSILAPRYGLVFDLPQDWQENQTAAGLAFSGPATSRTEFATVSVQAAPQESDLVSSLAAMHAALEQRTQADLTFLPGILDGCEALFYVQVFPWIDVRRLRAGALVATPRGILDVSCAAPTSDFAEAAPAWEELLATLVVL